jgi:hypothetical protein
MPEENLQHVDFDDPAAMENNKDSAVSKHSDCQEVSRLLADLKNLAAQLTKDASALVSHSRGAGYSEEYSVLAARIKDHINAARKNRAALDDLSAEASNAQIRTVVQVGPLIDRIAGETAGLLQSIDECPKRLRMGEYKDLIESNSDMASQFAALIAAFVDFGGGPKRSRSVSGTT